MPFLRAFDKPRFQTYGEFVSFFSLIHEMTVDASVRCILRRSGERHRFIIMRNYLDDRVRLPRDAPIFPGFKKLLKLGAVVAV